MSMETWVTAEWARDFLHAQSGVRHLLYFPTNQSGNGIGVQLYRRFIVAYPNRKKLPRRKVVTFFLWLAQYGVNYWLLAKRFGCESRELSLNTIKKRASETKSRNCTQLHKQFSVRLNFSETFAIPSIQRGPAAPAPIGSFDQSWLHFVSFIIPINFRKLPRFLLRLIDAN